MKSSIWSLFEVIGILLKICTHIQLTACTVHTSLWTRDAVTSVDTVCPQDAIRSAQTSSQTSCGNMCSSETGCTAFSFATTLVPNCYLLAELPVPGAGCVTALSAKHFKKKLCHPDDGLYRTYKLVDGTSFTYRIVHESTDAVVAKQRCVASGGYLARLSSVAKIQFIQEIMNTCPGFGGDFYWIDGKNDYVAAPGVWRWADRTDMNMNITFWGDGRPNTPQTEHCNMMDVWFNWRFNDADCGWTPSYYICEKDVP